VNPRHHLGDLELEQKASLLSGHGFWTTTPVDAAGIPSIVLADGPHGIRYLPPEADHIGLASAGPATCFPPAVAVGSSWDPDVAARVGAALGREARALGVSVVLGPGVNIKRTPLCGRNFEYYSEDPLLSGVLGAAHVRALQSEGPGASVKHFAVNNQETERMRISAEVDERTLREIYLPAFERVVTEAKPATVMCSYNRVNGVYSAQNRWLLTDVLREEWGFTGAVISDWGAVHDRVAALAAGLDLEMPGNNGASDHQIVEAVARGDLDPALVDASARRVAALSLLRPSATDNADLDAHHALARELAGECAVLLRNERAVLPLSPTASIAVIGAFATQPRYQGGGSSHITPTRLDTALDALRAQVVAAGGAVVHEPGFTLDGSGDVDALCAAAVEVARTAQVAVVFAGPDQDDSEGFDRETLDLPAGQVELIRAVAVAAPRTVVVLSNGGVVSMEDWHDEVDAILEGWLLGQAGGAALADILLGVINPSGHLAETIPLSLRDTPSYLTFPGEAGRARYGEGVMVGYRHYETVKRPVRYPFGHGLSFTTFMTDGLEVAVAGDDTALATVTVSNTGFRAGRHVVQVYVATAAGPVRRPARELRAFKKVMLRPGETRRVELALDRRAFAYYDVETGRWIVAPGQYHIQVGHDAAHIAAEAIVTLPGDVLVRQLSLDSALEEWIKHPVVGPMFIRSLRDSLSNEMREQAEDARDGLRMVASMPLGKFLQFTGIAIAPDSLASMLELGQADIPTDGVKRA